jgi:hypothetical protein
VADHDAAPPDAIMIIGKHDHDQLDCVITMERNQ